MKKFFALILFFCASGVICADGQVRFGAPFSSNMVVRQNSNNNIWGYARPSQSVYIVASWAAADTVVAKADNYGKWSAVITTPAADNKAHTISANDITIKNIAIGEVWLCSGQSNMEWSVNHGIKNGEQAAADATNPNIRIFQVPLHAADSRQEHLDAHWSVCSPTVMRSASAIGYFFARELNAALGVPIGIISDAWGGTNAETWVDSRALYANKNLSGKLTDNSNEWRTGKSGAAYNAMIFPLMPFSLSGVIWYQGESNCDNAQTHPEAYEELLKTLIDNWRAGFKSELPFYLVQIAPFNYGQDNMYAATLRQQQLQIGQNISKTGVVVTNDLVEDINNIHPKDKQRVAARLAAFALAEVYGKNITDYKNPAIESIKFEKDKALLSFANTESGLVIDGKKAVGLKIAGAEGLFYPAQADVDKSGRLVVWSSKVKKPVKVSYCYDNATVGNIFSGAGLPVAPFLK